MQLLISDANILIDLEEGQLIDVLFQLPYEFNIPDILFVEELEEEHEHLLALGLKLNSLESNTMLYAMKLIPRYTKASRNDCFALALATQEKCALLTGDKALKEAAEAEAVMVKGTLWLIEQMVRLRLINTTLAREAYARMQDAGRRLPWGIAEEILKALDKELDRL